MFLNPGFKMTACFANVVRTKAIKKNVYTNKDFKSSGKGTL